MELNPGGVIGVLIVAVIFLVLQRRPILAYLRRAKEAPRRREEDQEITRKAAGGRPPMNAGDVEDLRRWIAANALPFTACALASQPASSAQGSHAGGQPWLPVGIDWPKDQRGDPMVFLLQINFSEVPPLAEFPDRGLLLFFVAADDAFGARNAEDSDDIRVIYAPDLAVAGAAVPLPLRTGQTPFHDPRAETEGRAISFAPVAEMTPWGSDWRIDDLWPGWWARGDEADFGHVVDAASEQRQPESWIGGNLDMIHGDPRAEAGWRDLDRVLLRIGSDDNIHWGDVGVACFLISRSDLAARDFSRVRFSWDSH